MKIRQQEKRALRFLLCFSLFYLLFISLSLKILYLTVFDDYFFPFGTSLKDKFTHMHFKELLFKNMYFSMFFLVIFETELRFAAPCLKILDHVSHVGHVIKSCLILNRALL